MITLNKIIIIINLMYLNIIYFLALKFLKFFDGMPKKIKKNEAKLPFISSFFTIFLIK